MSTRANVILFDTWTSHEGKKHTEKLYFYRHSDGYPEGVKETLDKFCNLIKDKKIRNNLSQSAGWLIMIGASEYDYVRGYGSEDYGKPANSILSEMVDSPPDWKAGAYEPTTGLHGDIEHLYIVDVQKGEWKEEENWKKWE